MALEALMFLGSEDYPFPNACQLLSKRCLASSTVIHRGNINGLIFPFHAFIA